MTRIVRVDGSVGISPDIRRTLNIQRGDPVEVKIKNNGVFIKRKPEVCSICHKPNKIVDSMFGNGICEPCRTALRESIKNSDSLKEAVTSIFKGTTSIGKRAGTRGAK